MPRPSRTTSSRSSKAAPGPNAARGTEPRMVPDSCKPSNTSKRRLFFTSPMALPLATRDQPAQASQPTATTPWSTQQPSRWGRPPTTWRNYMACVRRSQTRGPGTTPTAAAHQDASTSSPTTCTPSTSVSASGRPKPTDRSSPPSKSSSPTCGDRLSSPLAGSRDTPMSKVMKRPISSPNLVPRPAHQTKSPPLCKRPSPTRAGHYQRGFPPARKPRPSPPLRRSHRPHTQPRALARGIDFSSFHAPKRRAHPPTECPHGVPLLLDRRSTVPPCLRCITLSPRDASLSPIRLRMDDFGNAPDSPPIPLVDVNFDEVTNSSADHFGISLRRPSLSPPISPTLAPLLSSVSDPSTGIPTIP